MSELPPQGPKQESPEDHRRNVVDQAHSHALTYLEYADRQSEFPIGYTVHYVAGREHIIAFGANHSNDPDNPQLEQIKHIIETEKFDVVFVEGISALNHPTARNHFIDEIATSGDYKEEVKHGEPSATVWIAHQHGIRAESPEPDDSKLYQELIGQGFSKESIALKELVGIIDQYLRGKRDESLEKYISGYRRNLKESLGIDDTSPLFDQIEEFAKKEGIDINRNNWQEEDRAHNLVDPVPWPGKELKVTNLVSTVTSNIRDKEILARTYDEFQRGSKKIFIVYGASHIHMLAPALEHLLKVAAQDKSV